MSHRKPRVLLVGSEPPPMGGIVQYCRDLLAGLDGEFEMRFFGTSIPYELRPSAGTVPRGTNFIARDGAVSAARQVAWAWRRADELRRTVRRRRPEIVHIPTCTGLGFWRNALHVNYARREGARVFWHLLGAIDDYWRDGSPLRRRMIRHCLDQADVHVVQSEGLREVVSAFTRRPVLAIYNGVPVDQFAPPDGFAHSEGGPEKVRVTAVGILGHRKGTFDLIEVAKRLCPEIPHLEFVLVGGGEVERFRRLVDEAGLTGRVTVPGMVDDDEKRRLLRASDVFALPSYSEGQPIAILEAMAAGLPVISTTIGSIPEVIRPRNGRLMTPGDLDALARHIRELAGSAGLRERIGRQNVREADEKYSLRRTIEEIAQVYRGLLSGAAGRAPAARAGRA